MKIDTSAEAVARVLALATQGKPVQFNPQFCEEAKGAKAHDWDTSHDLSVIRADGSRYKIGHFRHADDALFDQLARELVPALSRDLEAMRAEREEAIKILEGVAIPLAAGFPDEGDTLVRRAKRVADGLEIHRQGTIDLIDRMSDRSKVAELERNAAIARAEQAEADADSWKTRADLSQAAIAAKNAQILDLIEALRRRTDGEICGCGVDNPTDVCLSHYDVIEAVVRNRVQAAIATAMMGAAEHLYQLMMDNSDEALQAQIDCLLADMTLDGNPNLAAYFRDKLIASIPTDATAALEERDKQVRDEVLESAAVIAAKEGVYPELNVWNDGPDWYQHGKRIAAAIRAMKGGA